MTINFLALIPVGANLIFYILVLFFTIYGVFLAYHWFQFGTKKTISMYALTAYLIGGAILFLILAVLIGKI